MVMTFWLYGLNLGCYMLVCMWDQYTGLDTQTLVPKNAFQVFIFQLSFSKNMLNSDQWFHNASNFVKIA